MWDWFESLRNWHDTSLLWSVRNMGRIVIATEALVAHQFCPAKVKPIGHCFTDNGKHRSFTTVKAVCQVDQSNTEPVLFFRPYRTVHTSFTKCCPWLDKLQWLYEDYFTDDLCWSAVRIFDEFSPLYVICNFEFLWGSYSFKPVPLSTAYCNFQWVYMWGSHFSHYSPLYYILNWDHVSLMIFNIFTTACIY